MRTSVLILYAFCIFMTAFLGGLLPLLIPSKNDNHLKLFVSLGAGLLLGMSFLHMLPEASHLLPHSFGLWFLMGFVLLLILERFIMIHACDEHGCHYHTVGLTAFFGLTVHGVIEGLALGSSLVLPPLALLVLVAILAHKAPAGFALTSILRLAGKSKSQILLFSAGVALSGPLGLLLAYFFLHSKDYQSAAGSLLALSAGTFVYIGACDLLPELHRASGEKLKRLFVFILGLLISYGSGILLEHHH
ncbi:MAG: ZIP family metal transporter [Pseudomonadota bacterium]